jgi:hypothetical protein
MVLRAGDIDHLVLTGIATSGVVLLFPQQADVTTVADRAAGP